MKSHIIKTWRDPYDEGFSTTRARKITINSGLTVLVGCNGAGKTTLLHNIKSELKKEHIPCILFDNKVSGGSTSMSASMLRRDYTLFATQFCSSEGENITISLGQVAKSLGGFLKTGESEDDIKRKKWRNMLGVDEEEDSETLQTNERWILFDAIDSGYSIDNILDLKQFFEVIFEDSDKQSLDTYIIVSCNEYELANGEQCFDVMSGKYVTFKDYGDFRKFIISTRAKKEKRVAKVESNQNKVAVE